MKIYVTHSSAFDFKSELYQPLRSSSVNKMHEFVLPHETSSELFSTAESLKDFDLIVAEASYPSTGQGIELGWAFVQSIPIICIYKKGHNPSKGLKMITNVFLGYKDPDDMVEKLSNYLLKI